jgi:hypothetical protein
MDAARYTLEQTRRLDHAVQRDIVVEVAVGIEEYQLRSPWVVYQDE